MALMKAAVADCILSAGVLDRSYLHKIKVKRYQVSIKVNASIFLQQTEVQSL